MANSFESEINEFVKNSDSILPMKQNDPLLPQHPFRMLITGPSGCGKTTIILNLLLDKGHYTLNYTRVFIFCKMLDEKAYMFLKSELQKKEDGINEKLEKIDVEPIELFSFHNDLDELPDINDLDKSRQTIFIFDDFVKDKNQKEIEKYYIMARKKNCSMIYLSQSYFETPKDIRLQVQYYANFNIPSKRELINISIDHTSDIDKDDFMNMVQSACMNNGLLLIDKTKEGNKEMKYRFNFTECSKWSS